MMHLYSAQRARPLAARLAEVLSEPPADPMTPEWLAVPSDGMRRWVTLELARHLGNSGPGAEDGIAANFVRAYPGTLRTGVLDAGRNVPAVDPWSIDRLVWAVLAVAHKALDDPGLADLLALPHGASRYARARRVADLFDRYHLHRPAMVRAWAAGRSEDGVGRLLPDHDRWQPHLWRLVRDHVGEASPPERIPDLLADLRDGALVVDLPERLTLFGFTLLPGGGFLQLAQAVAVHRDVHLFLLEPCHIDADRLRTVAPDPSRDGPQLRAGDPTAGLIDQPLLRSWGRLSRESAVLVAGSRSHGVPNPQRLDSSDGGTPPTTVLGRLQHDIRTNRRSAGSGAYDPSDRSVQFHACFGPIRQVEVARDALLHLLATPGSGLSEDDIVVLCPDLDRFAPLIDAVFGPAADATGESHRRGFSNGAQGAPSLRYRIADQSIRSTNPVLGAVTSLLQLVTGRLEGTTVLDFLSLGPVRERFRFDDEDLATVAEWVRATNVRWGLDPDHRSRFGVPASIVTNTWRAALDRLLMGASVFDSDRALAVGGVAPYGVEGHEVDVLGRLAEAMQHIGVLVDEADADRPIAEWVQLVRSACDALVAGDRDTEWQVEALHRVFAEVIDSATDRGSVSVVPLAFVDVRRLFDERLDVMLGRPDFFRGGITFTSLTPLRWIPYRVVCLLGVDQPAFVSPPAAGDDLIAAAPQLGDRDPRGEVRESLLEAVLATGEHLLVVRDGHDVRTQQRIPRSVVAAELYDAVVATVAAEHRGDLEQHLEVEHPLHAFDERCFTSGALGASGPWGFDQVGLEAARARRGRSPRAEPFLPVPLDPVDTAVIDLADLQGFFRNPSAAFLTQRLGVRLSRQDAPGSDLLPVHLDGLDVWRIGDRMLAALLAGGNTEEWIRAERARGTLPPGVLEALAIIELESSVGALVAAARAHGVDSGPGRHYEIDVVLEDGTRVVGSVPLRLPEATPGPAHVGYSRMKPKLRLATWLNLMALVGSDPSTPWRSLAIGRPADSKVAASEVVELVPAASSHEVGAAARGAMLVAVDCYRRGLCEPIPLFPQVSYDLAHDAINPGHWVGRNVPGDGEHPAVRMAFGECDFPELMALPPHRGDPPGPGGRVERFAQYLWKTVEGSGAEILPPSARASGPAGARQ